MHEVVVMGSFPVKDIVSTRKFYGDVLGLEITPTSLDSMHIHLKGGGKLFVYEKVNHVPADYTVLYLAVPQTEAAIDELQGKGVIFDRYDDLDQSTDGTVLNRHGGTIAWFSDPSGNVIALTQAGKDFTGAPR